MVTVVVIEFSVMRGVVDQISLRINDAIYD